MREKVGKSRNTVFFQWFVAPEGRKVGSLKRRVRSQLATGAMKNCTPLWREAHFEVKSVKNWRSRTTFGSWDVKKVHAVVARSTFPSQNVQNTGRSRTTFGSWDVEKVHAVVARSTFPSQNVQNTKSCTKKCTPLVSDHFWRFRCRKSARRCGAKHISKSKYKTLGVHHYNYSTTLHYTTLHYLPLPSLHYTTLHCLQLQVQLQLHTTLTLTLHYTTLHYITLHYLPLHYTTLHYTPQHYNYTTTQLH